MKKKLLIIITCHFCLDNLLLLNCKTLPNDSNSFDQIVRLFLNACGGKQRSCLQWKFRELHDQMWLMIPSANPTQSNQKSRLHPLIQTLVGFTLAQDVEKKKSGAEAPHGL